MTAQRELTNDQPRREAMFWMLHECGVSYPRLARMAGCSVSWASENGRRYQWRIGYRQENASSWVEPWAMRLRAAGAIP